MSVMISRFFRVSPFKVFIAVVITLVASLQLGVINGSADDRRIAPRDQAGEAPVQKVEEPLITATSRFAFKFYDQLRKQDTNKNVFVSPSSVMFALAMTYNGAEGRTRQGMARTLEIEGATVNEVNTAFANLLRMLRDADPRVQLKIANSIWARQGIIIKPDFIERNKQHYAAEVTSLDFANAAAPVTINSWVKNKTDNLIESIVDRISPDTIMLLINSVYFKGQWKNQFEKEKTKEDDFHLANGQQKKVPMMFQSGQYLYFQDRDFQLVSLPYGTGKISMYVFLPESGMTLEEFERKLTFDNWETWMKSFRGTPGDVILPRFKVEYDVDLNDSLKALGMTEAFDPNVADFSGIADVNSGARIYISKVKHKSFAEVNEEGTKAAAVTSVTMSVTSAQVPQKPFVMKVDRPFFFAIRDNATGALLFMGSIMDPK